MALKTLRTMADGKIEVVLDEELGALFAVVRVGDKKKALRALEKLKSITLDAWQTSSIGLMLPITISVEGYGTPLDEVVNEFVRKYKPVEKELADALKGL